MNRQWAMDDRPLWISGWDEHFIFKSNLLLTNDNMQCNCMCLIISIVIREEKEGVDELACVLGLVGLTPEWFYHLLFTFSIELSFDRQRTTIRRLAAIFILTVNLNTIDCALYFQSYWCIATTICLRNQSDDWKILIIKQKLIYSVNHPPNVIFVLKCTYPSLHELTSIDFLVCESAELNGIRENLDILL